MVDWKLYIDSPQKRALDLCGGSLTEGDGYTDGDGRGGYKGSVRGEGEGCGYGYSNGLGWSSNKW